MNRKRRGIVVVEERSHLHSPFDPFRKKKNTGPPRNKKRCGVPDTSSKGCIKTKKENSNVPMLASRCHPRAPVPACGRDITLLTVPMPVARLSVTPKLNAAKKIESNKKEEEKHPVTPNPPPRHSRIFKNWKGKVTPLPKQASKPEEPRNLGR
jgi:hypothetical protein